MIFGGLNKFTLIDYPGKIACMVYTIGCNFRCPYCHNPELVTEVVDRKYDETEIYRFLEERVGKIEGVVITGGEPTIHKEDLLQFMQEVKNRGFLVKLDSNGTNPDFIKTAIGRGIVDYVAMDIKSPLETYHKVANMPVDTDAIKESIELLKQNKVEYEFRTTIIKCLFAPEDLLLILKKIQGAKKYYLQKFIPTKILNPQFLKKTTYTDEEFEEFKKTAELYVNYCGIR